MLALSPSIWAADFIFSTGTYVPGTTAPQPLTAGDVLQINTGGFKHFSGSNFTNQSGLVNWNGDNLYLSHGIVTNNAAGVWDAKSDNTLIYFGGAVAFNNAGTFRKSAGTGTTAIGSVSFTNTGTIDAQTGTINFNGGNAVFNAGTQFIGAGSNVVSSNAAFNGAFTSANLNLSSGTFTGNAAQINGAVNFTGGALAGTWAIASGQALNANNNTGAFKYLDGPSTVVTNNGTIRWQTNEHLYFQNGATLNNAGVFDLQTSGNFTYAGGAVTTFNNTGTLLKSGPAGTFNIGSIGFVSTGIIEAQAGGTINFNGGTAVFNAGTQFIGAGSNVVSSNATFNGAFTSANLNLSSGTFTGNAAQINGAVNFTGGVLAGTWAIASGQALNANNNTGAFKYLDGPSTVVTNNGTIRWQTNEHLYFQNGATLNNAGVFDLQTSASFVYAGGSVPTFNNTGTLLKTGAANTFSIGSINFVNSGIIETQTGTINFNGGTAVFNAGTQFIGAGSNVVSSNATFNGAFTSANLNLSSGTFTGNAAQINGTVNFTGGVLAGTWAIASGQALNANNNTGAFKYLDGPSTVVTNNGTIRWQTNEHLYLQNGATLTNNGLIDLQGASNLQYNGGANPVVNNAGTFRKSGTGTSAVTTAFNNSGVVEAQAGTLQFNATSGIQGTGTLNIGAAGAVVLGGASSVGTLTHNGGAGSLNLGSNTLTISGDYTNANFGTGNSFNRRANVATTGAATPRLLAAGDANQGVSGAGVANGVTNTPTMTIGNVRLGTTTATYNINNTGTTGPSLRGAIQTNVNGASLTDARLSGNGVTAGNWGPVATGTGLSRDVSFTVNSAGVYTPITGQSVNILNNFDNTRSQLLTINSAAGAAAYQPAQASTLATPVNLGNTRVGGTLSSSLAVTNTAPNTGGYTETLGATVTGTTGGVTTSGSVSALAHGGTSNAISAGFSTATAGAKSGSATLGFTTNEINNSGLGTLGIGSQTVNLTGNVYQAAQGSAANPVNLGNARVGGTLNGAIGVTNVAPNTGGFTETLGATVTGTTGGVSTSGSVSGLAQGASSNAISAGFSTATAGAKSGSATIGFTSSEINGSGLGTIGAGSQTVNVTGSVFRLAEATLGTVSFGNVLVGSSQTRYVTVTNSALADGFSEGLNAALGGFSGASAGLLSGSGTITNLAAGATNTTTLAVTLNTSSTGVVTANVQALLASNGATTSGLGILNLPSQSVPISGLIEGTVGNLAAAGPITPNPVNLGNVRVGAASPTQALSITNTQAGPAEGLNASFSGGSAGLTTSGSVNGLAPLATNSSSLVIGMNTATAGSRNGTATIALASDGSFNNGTPTSLGTRDVTVSGAVYQAAQGSAANPVNLGNARVGGTLNGAIGVTNVAPNTGGFTETLGATVTGTTGGVSTSGSVSGLAQGASSNAISAGFSTATAGAKSGTATIGFTSSEINGSGLGTIGAGSQTVNVTGAVYQAAQASTLTTPINLGTVRTGTVVNTTLPVTNIAPGTGGYTETLGATFGSASSGLTGLGSVSGLGAGASSNALSVRYTAGAAGSYAGSIGVNLVSQEINSSGLGNLSLGSQLVNVSANVNALAVFGLSNLSAYSFTSTGANSGLLDFGSFGGTSAFIAQFGLTNGAFGPSDSLLGGFNLAGLAGSPFSLSGANPFDLGAGASLPFSINFNPTSTGLFSATFSITSASHNNFQSDLSLGTYSLTLRGEIRGGTSTVPDSPVGLIGALALLATLFLGHRHQNRLAVACR